MKETILIGILLLVIILIVGYLVLLNRNDDRESFTNSEHEMTPVSEEHQHSSEMLAVAAEEKEKVTNTPVPTTMSSETQKVLVNEYYEYPETYIENKDSVDTDELYKGYSGPLKGKTQWSDMTLAQCQDACNSMTGCVGFSRNNVDANTEGTCKPRSKIAQCHSIRKGNPSQRSLASGYTSYIKKGVDSQMTKCIGASITLNRSIYIKSIAKPFHYVAIEDNSVILKEFKSTGVEFAEKCKFYMIAGLENSNTVSFRMTDMNDISYYLVCDSKTNQLNISPINIVRSTLAERKSASFELYDGLSNEYMVSIRNPSMDGKKAMYLSISEISQDNQRIKLVSLDEANTSEKTQKMATFDILDYVEGSSIVTGDVATPMPTSMQLSTASPTSAIIEKYRNTNNSNSVNKRRAEQFTSPTLAPEVITNVTNALRKTSSNARYDELDQITANIQSLDANIINANTSIDETELLNKSEQELELWKNGVSQYNKMVNDKRKSLNDRISNLNKTAGGVQLHELARDYYFLKNKIDDTNS